MAIGDLSLREESGPPVARNREKAGEYFSVLIDDPMLAQPDPRPTSSAYGESFGLGRLQWTRPPTRATGRREAMALDRDQNVAFADHGWRRPRIARLAPSPLFQALQRRDQVCGQALAEAPTRPARSDPRSSFCRRMPIGRKPLRVFAIPEHWSVS